jgi:anti-anti-sigma factor
MREDRQFQHAVNRTGAPAIVTFPGDVDISNRKVIAAQLRAAFRPGVTVVIADLSETVSCDSAAIGHLWMAGNHAVCTGCQLRVVVGEGTVRKALDAFGAGQTLSLYPDMEAAMTETAETAPDAGLLGDVG